MAVQKPPISIPFGGLMTKGSPLARPSNTSVRCQNFRTMPGATGRGLYLRLRGGKTYRRANTGGTYRKFYEWAAQTSSVGANLALYTTDGGVSSWQHLDLTIQPYLQSTLHDGPNASAPIIGVRDKVVFGANSPSRNGTISTPALCSWDGTTVRFSGLDAYCPSGTYPTAVMTLGAGFNNIITSVDIWVGLYNTATGHYSNAIFCGRLTTLGTGTITVTNLARLTFNYNNPTEQGELKYVFYASVDGGETAYLVMNNALNGPFYVNTGSATANLNLTNISVQGFVLDFTQERPIDNNPPRTPVDITYANGRVYAAMGLGNIAGPTQPLLRGPGGTFYPDFDYALGNKGAGFIGWTATADDNAGRDFVGVPEESWPTKNRKYTPNGQTPQIVDGIPGTAMVLVLTNRGSYLLYEAADGLHQWITLSDEDGIQSLGQSYIRTPRGPMWITQRLQLVMLDKATLQMQALSTDFEECLSSPAYAGSTILAADYIHNAQQQIEYYEVWKSSSLSLVYDFAAGGVASTKIRAVNFGVPSAAKSMRDNNGKVHHIFSSIDCPIWSQEEDAVTGLIPTRDELSPGVFDDPVGDYITQWMAFDDPRVRKVFSDLDIIGDGEVSHTLTDTRPLAVSYWVDFDDSEEIPLHLDKSRQSSGNQDHNYKARLRTGNFFWIKFRYKLSGHGTDQTTYPTGSSSNGEVPPNFYGCIYDAALTESPTSNRP